jgi:hypothetical protein
MNPLGTYWVESFTPLHDDWEYNGGRWEDTPPLPLQVCVMLANDMGVSGWFPFPYGVSDEQMSWGIDYLIQNCDQPPVIEFANEAWNGGDKYKQQGDYLASISPDGDRMTAYASRVRRMSVINDGRCQLVLGCHLMNTGQANHLLETEGLHSYVDAISVAPYIAPSTWVDLPMTSVDDIHRACVSDLDNRITPQLEQFSRMAGRWQVGLFGYEGGVHYIGSADLLKSYDRSPLALDLLRQMRDRWTVVGGGLFCWYRLGGVLDNAQHFDLCVVQGDDVSRYPKFDILRG